MILLEYNGEGLDYFFAFFGFIIVGLPLILMLFGAGIKKNKPKAGKVLIILGIVYFIIAAGTCGILLGSS